MSTSATNGSARLFDIVCPSGWVRINPGTFDEHRIVALARQFARRADPLVRPVVADRIGTDLTARLQALAEAGALVVFMAGPTSVLSLAQPLVAISPLTWPDEVEPMGALMTTAAHDPTAQVFDLDEAVALRTWTRTAVEPAEVDSTIAELGLDYEGKQVDRGRLDGGDLAQYTVRYQIGLPQERDAWVEAVCAATAPEPDGADPEAVIALFDAFLSTFRWVNR